MREKLNEDLLHLMPKELNLVSLPGNPHESINRIRAAKIKSIDKKTASIIKKKYSVARKVIYRIKLAQSTGENPILYIPNKYKSLSSTISIQELLLYVNFIYSQYKKNPSKELKQELFKFIRTVPDFLTTKYLYKQFHIALGLNWSKIKEQFVISKEQSNNLYHAARKSAKQFPERTAEEILIDIKRIFNGGLPNLLLSALVSSQPKEDIMKAMEGIAQPYQEKLIKAHLKSAIVVHSFFEKVGIDYETALYLAGYDSINGILDQLFSFFTRSQNIVNNNEIPLEPYRHESTTEELLKQFEDDLDAPREIREILHKKVHKSIVSKPGSSTGFETYYLKEQGTQVTINPFLPIGTIMKHGICHCVYGIGLLTSYTYSKSVDPVSITEILDAWFPQEMQESLVLHESYSLINKNTIYRDDLIIPRSYAKALINAITWHQLIPKISKMDLNDLDNVVDKALNSELIIYKDETYKGLRDLAYQLFNKFGFEILYLDRVFNAQLLFDGLGYLSAPKGGVLKLHGILQLITEAEPGVHWINTPKAWYAIKAIMDFVIESKDMEEFESKIRKKFPQIFRG